MHMPLDGTMTSGIKLRPLTPFLGVEVEGVDVSGAISDGDAEALRAAFAQHRVLLLRNVELDGDAQNRFVGLFGEVIIRDHNVAKQAEDDVQYVSNSRADGILGTGDLDFHFDHLFHDVPLAGLALYGIEVGLGAGGDTKFCDTERALEKMPAPLRARIEKLSCRHDYTFSGKLAQDWQVSDATTVPLSAIHPIVHADPRTGRRGVWINKLTTICVVDLPADESAALIAEVRGYFADESITYTHEWRPGDLLIWENRTVQHARTPFDESKPRTLRRTTFI